MYHALQLLLAAYVAALISERTRTLFYRAPLEAKPYAKVALRAVRAGDWSAAEALARAGKPAWIAEVLGAAVEARKRGEAVTIALDEVLSELKYEAERSLLSLRVLSSLASVSGMLGAVIEVLRFLSGDVGLLGMMAGLSERTTAERALLAFVIGASTAAVAMASRRTLGRQAVRLYREAADMGAAIEEAVNDGEDEGRNSREKRSPLPSGDPSDTV